VPWIRFNLQFGSLGLKKEKLMWYSRHLHNPYSSVDGPEYGFSGVMGLRRKAKNSIQKIAKKSEKIRKNQKKVLACVFIYSYSMYTYTTLNNKIYFL